MAKDNNKICCDSCGFETIELKNYTSGSPQRTLKLCEICASTFVGNAAFYPGQYPYEEKALRTIAYIGNKILKKLNN